MAAGPERRIVSVTVDPTQVVKHLACWRTKPSPFNPNRPQDQINTKRCPYRLPKKKRCPYRQRRNNHSYQRFDDTTMILLAVLIIFSLHSSGSGIQYVQTRKD